MTGLVERLRPFFLLPREEASNSRRLYFLDGFRATALLVMVLSHSLKFWLTPAYGIGTYKFWRVLITRIPSPIFFFVLGTSYILSRDGRMRKGATREEVLTGFLKRSLFLFFLAFVYKAIDLLVGVNWRYVRWWEIDVLNILSLSLGVVALTDYLIQRFRPGRSGFLLLALLSASFHSLIFIPHLNLKGILPEVVRLYIQGTQDEKAWFTLLPYAGYSFFGAWMALRLQAGAVTKPFLGLKPVYLLFFTLTAVGWSLENFSGSKLASEIGYKTFYFNRAYLYLTAAMHAAFLFQRYVGFGPLLIVGTYTMVGYWVHAKIIFLWYKDFQGKCVPGDVAWLLLKVYAETFLIVLAWNAFKRRLRRKSYFLKK